MGVAARGAAGAARGNFVAAAAAARRYAWSPVDGRTGPPIRPARTGRDRAPSVGDVVRCGFGAVAGQDSSLEFAIAHWQSQRCEEKETGGRACVNSGLRSPIHSTPTMIG